VEALPAESKAQPLRIAFHANAGPVSGGEGRNNAPAVICRARQGGLRAPNPSETVTAPSSVPETLRDDAAGLRELGHDLLVQPDIHLG
jgi:hypothetical protein